MLFLLVTHRYFTKSVFGCILPIPSIAAASAGSWMLICCPWCPQGSTKSTIFTLYYSVYTKHWSNRPEKCYQVRYKYNSTMSPGSHLKNVTFRDDYNVQNLVSLLLKPPQFPFLLFGSHPQSQMTILFICTQICLKLHFQHMYSY